MSGKICKLNGIPNYTVSYGKVSTCYFLQFTISKRH